MCLQFFFTREAWNARLPSSHCAPWRRPTSSCPPPAARRPVARGRTAASRCSWYLGPASAAARLGVGGPAAKDVLIELLDASQCIKKLYPGRKRFHRFFIKRKPHRLTRVEKPPEPWPMPVRAKPYGEHNEGVFFSQQPEIRF